MKVSIISPVFLPEPVVSAQTSYELATELARLGHQVTVITSYPSRPGGRLYPGYRRRLLEQEQHPGPFRLVRCGSFISQKSSIVSRVSQNITFGILAAIAQVIWGRADVAYVNTWPLFAAGCAAFVCRVSGTPFVLSVQDVYPESLFARSRLRERSLGYRVLRSLDRAIAHSADRVVVLTHALARYYRETRLLAVDRVKDIPNWTDIPPLPAASCEGDYRERRGVSHSAFVIAYAGTFADSAGIDALIRAVADMASGTDTVLILAGDGPYYETCRALAESVKTARVLFHRPYRPEESKELLSAADVLVVPTRGEISMTALPSKLMHYMFAARPVLAICTTESALAAIVNESACGWAVAPDCHRELVQVLETIRRTPKQMLCDMGYRGRAYASEHFGKDACLTALIRIVEVSAGAC